MGPWELGGMSLRIWGYCHQAPAVVLSTQHRTGSCQGAYSLLWESNFLFELRINVAQDGLQEEKTRILFSSSSALGEHYSSRCSIYARQPLRPSSMCALGQV